MDVSITRHLEAPRRSVWAAFTDPERLRSWFWPPSFGTLCAVEARVGGGYSIRSESAGIAVTGRFESVSPEHGLVATWRWDGDEQESRFSLDLEEEGEGTRLALLHDGLTDEQEVESHRAGWESCLDRLPAHLARHAE